MKPIIIYILKSSFCCFYKLESMTNRKFFDNANESILKRTFASWFAENIE